MNVTRILNNNAVCSQDKNGQEIVVMGKGIGFQKRSGDRIEEDKVEKIFSLPGSSSTQFEKLVSEIPYEHIQTAAEIIEYARQSLSEDLNKNIYVSLTDHINFAIERAKQGMVFENALLWEIRKFYSAEYAVGVKAIELIEKRLGVSLSEDEAGFIALHIVNARLGGQMKQSMEAPEMIKDIMNLVKFTFQMELDESSLAYERFLTHLKFCIQRAVRKECYPNDDMPFYESVRNKYPKAFGCAQKIKKYMEQKLQCEVEEEEVLYLTMHIARIARRTE